VKRMIRRAARAYILTFGVYALQAGRAHAQAPTLTPPELLQDAEADYPEEARAARLEATVVLKLTIDAQGVVSDAEVIEPAGHGFDEAARQASLRFRFAPAKRDGFSDRHRRRQRRVRSSGACRSRAHTARCKRS
jgi:TonB family protein